MIVKFYMEESRAKAIVAELEDKVQILEIGEVWTIEVAIDHAIDAMKLFHAGINYVHNSSKVLDNSNP